MLVKKSGFWQTVKAKWRNEGGTATVEFVIMFPLFILLLSLIVDVALIFYGQAQALRVIQDANRNFSIGRYTTVEQTAANIEQELLVLTSRADATSFETTTGSISSYVLIPAADLTMIGWISILTDFTIGVQAEHLVEF